MLFQTDLKNFRAHSKRSKGSISLGRLLHNAEKEDILTIPKELGMEAIKLLISKINQRSSSVCQYKLFIFIFKYCMYPDA